MIGRGNDHRFTEAAQNRFQPAPVVRDTRVGAACGFQRAGQSFGVETVRFALCA